MCISCISLQLHCISTMAHPLIVKPNLPAHHHLTAVKCRHHRPTLQQLGEGGSYNPCVHHRATLLPAVTGSTCTRGCCSNDNTCCCTTGGACLHKTNLPGKAGSTSLVHGKPAQLTTPHGCLSSPHNKPFSSNGNPPLAGDSQQNPSRLNNMLSYMG